MRQTTHSRLTDRHFLVQSITAPTVTAQTMFVHACAAAEAAAERRDPATRARVHPARATPLLS